MRPFWAGSADVLLSTQIRPAHTSLGDRVCATVARVFAYVGTLALVAILAIHVSDRLRAIAPVEPATRAAFSLASRSDGTFEANSLGPTAKSATYTLLWHPDGGRKDIFRWSGSEERPLAELEIYRPGREAGAAAPVETELAGRMSHSGAPQFERGGVIDSKFGPFALLRPTGASGGDGSCLGFFKGIDDPKLRISGWSCAAGTLSDQRAAIECMLDRLVLVAPGNEPGLASLFARAELNRRGCPNPGAPGTGRDWLTDAEIPHLRGSL